MYKYAKQAYGFPKGCLVALLISLLSYLSLSLLCCTGVFMTKNLTVSLKLISFIAYLLSAAISGFMTAKLVKTNQIITEAIASLAFSCAIFIIALVSGGNALNTLMNIVCYCALAILSCYLGAGKRRKRRNR